MFLTVLTVGCFYSLVANTQCPWGRDAVPLTCHFLGVLYRFEGILWSVGMTCLGMLLDFKNLGCFV